MDSQTIGIIVFIILLGLFLFLKRKDITIDKIAFPVVYIFMLRTKWGLSMMDWLAKRFKKPLLWIGYSGIVIGFLGMALITFSLFLNIYNVFFVPGSVSGVMPVLPFEMKGALAVILLLDHM